ncbi:hypothetical protein KC640_01745, partial [Candidatus Dojkabacteria bacterium]|nr:hypothetical protein [Candidatus Dojkabacteria bacterium]
ALAAAAGKAVRDEESSGGGVCPSAFSPAANVLAPDLSLAHSLQVAFGPLLGDSAASFPCLQRVFVVLVNEASTKLHSMPTV